MQSKRFLCLFLAFMIISFLAVSAFCFDFIPSIYDVFGFIYDVGDTDVPYYTESQWNSMSDEERRAAFTNAVNIYHGEIIDPAHFYDTVNNSGIDLYAFYSTFVKDPLSPYANADSSIRAKTMVLLEMAGVADFGLGYYKPADNTVADTLNDDFLKYQQNHPINDSTYKHRVTGVNGNYVEFEGMIRSPINSLHSEYLGGKSLVIAINFYYADGTFYQQMGPYGYGCGDLASVTFSESVFPSPPDYFGYSIFLYFSPSYMLQEDGGYVTFSTYFRDNDSFEAKRIAQFLGYGVTDSSPLVEDNGTPGTIEDDDGNKHDVIILPNGVLIDGDFYEFNPDYTVTYGDNIYNTYPDYSQVDNNYYQEFLEQTLNYYYNYYNTPGSEFDDTNIIKSLQSIFRSLETFRANAYAQLQQIITYITDIPQTINSAAGRIITAIKNIKFKVDNDINIKLDTEEDKEKALLGWIDLIDEVKKKFCVDTVQANIKNIRSVLLGSSVTAKETGELVAEYDLVTIEYDSSGKAIPVVSRVSSVYVPAITFEILGQEYNLLSGISAFDSSISMVKGIISAFLLCGFFLAFFRSLPNIIGNVGAIVGFANSNDGTDKLDDNGFFGYM